MACVFFPNRPRRPPLRIFTTFFANSSAVWTAAAWLGSAGSGMYDAKLTSSNMAGGTI